MIGVYLVLVVSRKRPIPTPTLPLKGREFLERKIATSSPLHLMREAGERERVKSLCEPHPPPHPLVKVGVAIREVEVEGKGREGKGREGKGAIREDYGNAL